MRPYDDRKSGPRRVLDGLGPLFHEKRRQGIGTLRNTTKILVFAAWLGLDLVRDELKSALKKTETPVFHLEDPDLVRARIGLREQIEGLPEEIWIHIITGVRNGLQDHLLRDVFANPDMIQKGIQASFGEAHREMNVITHVSRWAQDNATRGDRLAMIPGAAIVTDFAEIHMDEEYQEIVINKEVAKIEKAMLTQDFLILSAHSQGNNLLIHVFEKLEERGTLAAFRQKGGKVLFVGLSPAYTGPGPQFLQRVNDLLGADYEFIMDPKRVHHVFQELCDFGVILRGQGDSLAGPVDLPETISHDQDPDRAVGLNREFRMHLLKCLMTMGIAPHAAVWTQPELKELITLAVEAIYMCEMEGATETALASK